MSFGYVQRQQPLGPLVGFSIATAQVDDDAGEVVLAVTRTRNSAGACSVHYQTVAGTALENVDFTAASGTLSWADGNDDPQSIHVPILAPVRAKWDESTGSGTTLADAHRTASISTGSIDSIELAPRAGKVYGEIAYGGGATLSGGQKFYCGVYQNSGANPYLRIVSDFTSGGSSIDSLANTSTAIADIPTAATVGVLVDWDELTVKLSIDGQFIDTGDGSTSTDPNDVSGQALIADVAVLLHFEMTEAV